MIAGPAWLHDRYHQGTSMITWPISSRDQHDHRTGVIQGPVWSYDRYHQGTSKVTAAVWLQDRDDHSASIFTTSVWSQDPEEFVLKNQLIYLCSKSPAERMLAAELQSWSYDGCSCTVRFLQPSSWEARIRHRRWLQEFLFDCLSSRFVRLKRGLHWSAVLHNSWQWTAVALREAPSHGL